MSCPAVEEPQAPGDPVPRTKAGQVVEEPQARGDSVSCAKAGRVVEAHWQRSGDPMSFAKAGHCARPGFRGHQVGDGHGLLGPFQNDAHERAQVCKEG